MTRFPQTAKRILAIDPTSHGFGFAVLEGSHRLIDWGMKHCRENKNEQCREEVLNLLAHYGPEVLIVEDVGTKGCQRRTRVRRLIESLCTLAKRHHLRVKRIPRRCVQRCFALGRPATKRQVAEAVAERFPELEPRLPPTWDKLVKRRHLADSEDERMGIFDAVAFALTFYERSHRTCRTSSPIPLTAPSSNA